MTASKVRIPFFSVKRRAKNRRLQEMAVKHVSESLHHLDKDLADIEPDDLVWENEFDPNKTPDGRGRGKR